LVGARPRLWRLQRPLLRMWLLEVLLLLLRVLRRSHHGAAKWRPQALLRVRCPLLLLLLRMLCCLLLLSLRLLCV